MKKRTLRKAHRWIGLVAGFQLLAWTISGLYFTLIPIDEIRGSHLLVTSEQSAMKLGEGELISLSTLASIHIDIVDIAFSEVTLVDVLGEPVFIIDDHRYSAKTGKELAQIKEDVARAIVRDRTELKIANVRYIEEVATDGEYRGGELPAWQINLVGDEQAVVYVGALSGKIRAVRTQPWRWFDFLWSLHIMDYEEREDFNHLLIQVMASLSLLTVLSGLALFLSTQRWPVKR